MGLTSLPTRVSGSVGETKEDFTIRTYSNKVLPAGEWNNSAQAVVDVSAEVGLHDGTTSGSLVAKVKEFIRLDTATYGISQFSASNPLPGPALNSGWINPTITASYSTTFPGNSVLEIRADGTDFNSYNSAIWWFDQTFPFQSCKIEYGQGLGVSQSVPGASDIVFAGLIFAGDSTYGSGLSMTSGFFGSIPTTFFTRHDMTGSGAGVGVLIYTSSVGAYASKTEIDIYGSRVQGTGPLFIQKYNGIDVLDNTASKMISAAQIGFLSTSWISGSCNRVGIVLFGSCSAPVTMSIYEAKIYPRPGDSGAPLI